MALPRSPFRRRPLFADLVADALLVARAGVRQRVKNVVILRTLRDGADFDLAQYRHRAVYNELAGRIETHIVSRVAQEVRVDGGRVAFGADEPMLVEYSYKYAQDEFERMAARAGLRVAHSWSDPAHRFSIELLQRA